MKNVLMEHLYHKPLIDEKELLDTLHTYRDMVAPYVGDVSTFLYEANKAGKTILLEGQLGTLKDPDHGIYPMVTSSSTLAAYGAIGAGVPPYEIKQVITVCKAYSSAVGAGAFVSEIFGDEAYVYSQIMDNAVYCPAGYDNKLYKSTYEYLAGYFGSGEQFDWKALASYDGHTPFLLSGGIGPEDANRIKAFSHPQFAGIDLNSKFETAPALKDVEKLKTFIQEIRQDA